MPDLNFLFPSKHRIAEADVLIETQVIALPGATLPLRPTSRSTEATEEGFKQVGEATHVAHVGHAASRP